MRRGASGLHFFQSPAVAEMLPQRGLLLIPHRCVHPHPKSGVLCTPRHITSSCAKAWQKSRQPLSQVRSSQSAHHSFRQPTLRACKKGRPPTPSLRSLSLTVSWLQPTAEAPHPMLRPRTPASCSKRCSPYTSCLRPRISFCKKVSVLI